MYFLPFYCRAQDFLKQGEIISYRCDEWESLISRGCPKDMIENPHGEKRVDRNKEVTNLKEKVNPEEITQIQPQKLTLTLRSGAFQCRCS